MRARTFNGGVMHIVNEKWAGKVLGMEHNTGKGPDLRDDKKFLEIKFCLVKPKRNGRVNYPSAWTVQEHQVGYNEIFSLCFWGLGLYELDKPVKKIRTIDYEELEIMVVQRELYIVKWNWIDQFPPHRCRGKTHFSKWDNTFRYPKRKYLPPTTQTIEVEKGLVRLTEGVPDYLF